MLSYQRPQGHTVLTAQGMVAYESVALAVVGRQIFATYHRDIHFKVLYARFEPRHALFVLVLAQKAVHTVLVKQAFQPVHSEARHVARLTPGLVAYDFINIDNQFLFFCHNYRQRGFPAHRSARPYAS